MRRTILAVAALLSLTIASETASAQKPKRGDRSLITRQDLDEAGGSITNAIEAIQRLRPNWMQPKMGQQSSAGMADNFGSSNRNATSPVYYIDERRTQSDDLRAIRLEAIVSIKYLDQNRAVQMLGPGHESGAIMVTTTNAK